MSEQQQDEVMNEAQRIKNENSFTITARYDPKRGAVIRVRHGQVNMTRGQAAEMYAAALNAWTRIVGEADGEFGPNGQGESFFEECTRRATAMQPVDFQTDDGTESRVD